MNEELVAAFELIYDTCVDGEEGFNSEADELLHILAEKLLNEEEFVEFTDGYDKQGNPVIR